MYNIHRDGTMTLPNGFLTQLNPKGGALGLFSLNWGSGMGSKLKTQHGFGFAKI